jgi:hypothetical protein
MAVEAVELLRKKGFKAHRMEQGVATGAPAAGASTHRRSAP